MRKYELPNGKRVMEEINNIEVTHLLLMDIVSDKRNPKELRIILLPKLKQAIKNIYSIYVKRRFNKHFMYSNGTRKNE